MKEYVIEEVNYGFDFGYCGYASELKLKSPDGKTMYVTLFEVDDQPKFYRSEESIYSKLTDETFDDEQEKQRQKYCFLEGEDYIDIFQKMDPEWLDICRYLIFIATEDEESVEKLVKETKGKAFKDIEVPVPEREPEDLIKVDYSELSAVYRYRLMVEANLKNPSVYSDIDDTVKREKAILEKLKAACESEEAYKVWKKDLIDEKIKFTMVPKTSETILVNQRVGKFFLGDNPIGRIPFIYSTLKQLEIVSEVINRGQGSAQPNISASDIMSIPCVIPNSTVLSH